MSDDFKRIEFLSQDVMLLNTLGTLVTIQIDLVDVESYADTLAEVFNDSENQGLYVESMILQRITEDKLLDHHSIFNQIVEITGEYESIEGITALIRIKYGDSLIEITLQLDGHTRMPQLLQVTDSSAYFPLLNLIQTRWAMASRMRA